MHYLYVIYAQEREENPSGPKRRPRSVRWFHAPKRRLGCAVTSMAQPNAIFDQIDADKSGEIDSKELMMALLGLGQEHETVSDLFRVLDTDGNGSISREEFIHTHTRHGHTAARSQIGHRPVRRRVHAVRGYFQP